MHYEIRLGKGLDGEWWTVVAYREDGTCLGGDAHWLAPRFAYRAKELYETGQAAHGSLREV